MAVPAPGIDPRLVNASGCPPSAFRLLPCGEPPGACSPTLNRVGLPILRHWIKIGKAGTCFAGTLLWHCTPARAGKLRLWAPEDETVAHREVENRANRDGGAGGYVSIHPHGAYEERHQRHVSQDGNHAIARVKSS